MARGVQADGATWLALDYVEGITLADLLAISRAEGEPMSPRLCAHLAAEVAAGLHHLHVTARATNNALHRNVSPQVVIVTSRPR